MSLFKPPEPPKGKKNRKPVYEMTQAERAVSDYKQMRAALKRRRREERNRGQVPG